MNNIFPCKASSHKNWLQSFCEEELWYTCTMYAVCPWSFITKSADGLCQKFLFASANIWRGKNFDIESLTTTKMRRKRGSIPFVFWSVSFFNYLEYFIMQIPCGSLEQANSWEGMKRSRFVPCPIHPNQWYRNNWFMINHISFVSQDMVGPQKILLWVVIKWRGLQRPSHLIQWTKKMSTREKKYLTIVVSEFIAN